MVGLLRDLQPRHRWRLFLWHGDHGWRADSARQARELQAWAQAQGLPIRIERHDPSQLRDNREAAARHWRYACLHSEALRLGCRHVITAHTATDRAETVLLHLARGCHRRGLAGLRRRLPLPALLDPRGAQPRTAAALDPQGGSPPQLWLVRPLQIFSRGDTLRLCQREHWPVWPDPSNDRLEFSRNRVRAQVLPVLEELHPGATRRISEQAERLAAELEQQQELLDLALASLTCGPLQLDRRALLQLSDASQGLLLQHWLHQCSGRGLESRGLASLLSRLPLQRGNGAMDLAGGWQLSWRGTTLALRSPRSTPCGHG